MSDFFKPRRGTQAAAIEKLKDGKQLRTGELFFELEYEGSTKTVKSGRIMIGDGHSSYEQLVRYNRYVFNPDDYMGVTSKFEPTPSTETTITDNRNIINSGNTNIKEKMGAIDGVIKLLDENKSNKTHNHTTSDIIDFGSHNHTTADITDFVASVESIKVNNASTADYADKATKDGNDKNIADTYVTNLKHMIDCGVFSTGSLYAHYTNDSSDQFSLYNDYVGNYGGNPECRSAFPYFKLTDKYYACILDMRIYIYTDGSGIYKLKMPVVLKNDSKGIDQRFAFTAVMEKECDIMGDIIYNTLYLQFIESSSETIWKAFSCTTDSEGLNLLYDTKINIQNVKYIYYTY